MKQFLKFLFFTGCTAVTFYLGITKNEVHDLPFNNIEALANAETGNGVCFGTGSVDCNGHKVDYKMGGYSLEDYE